MIEERLQFVSKYLEGGWSISELSRAFGISRKTAYTFIARYEADGLEGLEDASRTPRWSVRIGRTQRWSV